MTQKDGENQRIAKRILGDCYCHPAYKGRGLKDPSCSWCENGYLFVEALEAKDAIITTEQQNSDLRIGCLEQKIFELKGGVADRLQERCVELESKLAEQRKEIEKLKSHLQCQVNVTEGTRSDFIKYRTKCVAQTSLIEKLESNLSKAVEAMTTISGLNPFQEKTGGLLESAVIIAKETLKSIEEWRTGHDKA